VLTRGPMHEESAERGVLGRRGGQTTDIELYYYPVPIRSALPLADAGTRGWTMTRVVTTMLTAAALSLLCLGCGRMFAEGMGAAKGASGKVVEIGTTPDLTKYKGMRIEVITVAQGSQAPAGMPAMIRADLAAAAEKRGLRPEGMPGLRLFGEIVHYEASSTVDTAIGPLEQVVVRTKLTDAQSGAVVAEANLIGRSKASSSSGAVKVSAGVGEALEKWLEDGGLKKTS